MKDSILRQLAVVHDRCKAKRPSEDELLPPPPLPIPSDVLAITKLQELTDHAVENHRPVFEYLGVKAELTTDYSKKLKGLLDKAISVHGRANMVRVVLPAVSTDY